MNQSLERLSSGYRINSAKDDASGLSISNSLTSNVAGANIAQQNISQATSLLQVADGGMSTVSDILTRMNQLATEAASAGADIGPLQMSIIHLTLKLTGLPIRRSIMAQICSTELVASGSNAISATDYRLANIYNVNASSAAIGTYTVGVAALADTLTMTKGRHTGSR